MLAWAPAPSHLQDHIIWMPGDIGACWLPGYRIVQNPIKIVHFGLQVRHASSLCHAPISLRVVLPRGPTLPALCLRCWACSSAMISQGIPA